MTWQILTGDALDTLRTLPEASVQMVCTSPPYYALRNYNHNGQIGLESTPQEYVSRLVAVFEEVKRVLRDDGVLFLNLGDSYSSGNSGQMASSHGSDIRNKVDHPQALGLVEGGFRVAIGLRALPAFPRRFRCVVHTHPSGGAIIHDPAGTCAAVRKVFP